MNGHGRIELRHLLSPPRRVRGINRLDGLEAARRIRERETNEGGRRTPMVGVTASALESDRQACYAAGMDAVLVKPYKGDALFTAIKAAVENITAQASM